MATSCEEVSARMMELLYGELPEAERAAIEAHLQTDGGGCARCRQELASFQSTRAIARRALDETPPARAHQAILRAAAEAAAARSKAPAPPAEPTRASFWQRLAARWTLPTLATVGAVAVFLLASRIFLEPEKTYERGRQGLLPAPAEGPAPAAPESEAAPRGQAPAPEAQPIAHGADSPESAAPAERARIRAAAKGGGSIGLGGLGNLGGPGSFGSFGTSPSPAKRRAAPEHLAKATSDLAPSQEFAQPPAAADRADRSFAPPPPPPREPARPAKKASGGLADDLDGAGAASAGAAPAGALAEEAPVREKNQKSSESAAAPAAPPASAPAAGKRERIVQLSADDLEKDEASAGRDKNARKPETPVAHADRLYSQGRWAEAAAAYRELLARDPRNADAARWRQRLAAAESALTPTAAPPR